MEYTFDVAVTQAHADLALRRFVFRGLGPGVPIALCVCLGYLAWDARDGVLETLSVVMVSLIALLVVIYLVAVRQRRQQMKELLSQLAGTPVRYHVQEGTLSAKSTLGSSSFPWEVVREVWVESDVTLLFYARNGYVTIPNNQVPEDAMEYILERVTQAGGKVKSRHSPTRA